MTIRDWGGHEWVAMGRGQRPRYDTPAGPSMRGSFPMTVRDDSAKYAWLVQDLNIEMQQ
jgi:hypothetical protein